MILPLRFSARRAALLTVILLGGLVPTFATEAKPLSNRDATPEARAVYTYLCELRGKAILAGQQETPHPGVVDSDEVMYVQRTTGKLPAVLGLDYIDYVDVTERAIDWWRRGGLPSICWHWGAPTRGTGYEASKKAINLSEALTPGTELNRAMLADLDRTAVELVRLRDAHVPVLWRPLHELNGNWFWWGKGTPEQFKQLWRLMYERYTRHFGLNNLIWVLGYTSKPDAAWYPGDDCVDIAGADNYAPGTQRRMFEGVQRIVGDRMPIAYHECGPIPDPEELKAEGTAWSWFLTWHTIHVKQQNEPVYLKRVYQHPYVITLDELPKFVTPPAPGATGR